jgi:hypothetical protein
MTVPSEIILLQWGGSGNSMDRNYHYSIEKDINLIAGSSNNTNIGFSNLF